MTKQLNNNQELTLKEAREYYNLFKKLYLLNKEEVDEHNATLENQLDKNRKFTDFFVLKTIENGRAEFEYGTYLHCLYETASYIAKKANADKSLIEKFKQFKKDKKDIILKPKEHDNMKINLSFFNKNKINFDILKVVYDCKSGIMGVYDEVRQDFITPNYATAEKKFWNTRMEDALELYIADFTEIRMIIEKKDYDDEDWSWKKENNLNLKSGSYFFDKDSKNEDIKKFFGYTREELEAEEDKE